VTVRDAQYTDGASVTPSFLCDVSPQCCVPCELRQDKTSLSRTLQLRLAASCVLIQSIGCQQQSFKEKCSLQSFSYLEHLIGKVNPTHCRVQRWGSIERRRKQLELGYRAPELVRQFRFGRDSYFALLLFVLVSLSLCLSSRSLQRGFRHCWLDPRFSANSFPSDSRLPSLKTKCLIAQNSSVNGIIRVVVL
jgi:hypothetical protein